MDTAVAKPPDCPEKCPFLPTATRVGSLAAAWTPDVVSCVDKPAGVDFGARRTWRLLPNRDIMKRSINLQSQQVLSATVYCPSCPRRLFLTYYDHSRFSRWPLTLWTWAELEALKTTGCSEHGNGVGTAVANDHAERLDRWQPGSGLVAL